MWSPPIQLVSIRSPFSSKCNLVSFYIGSKIDFLIDTNCIQIQTCRSFRRNDCFECAKGSKMFHNWNIRIFMTSKNSDFNYETFSTNKHIRSDLFWRNNRDIWIFDKMSPTKSVIIAYSVLIRDVRSPDRWFVSDPVRFTDWKNWYWFSLPRTGRRYLALIFSTDQYLYWFLVGFGHPWF